MIEKKIVLDTGKPTHASQMTPRSEYFGLENLWGSIPRDSCAKVDAVIAWPGIDIDRGIQQAAQFWNQDIGRYLLIAGYHVDEDAERLFSMSNLRKEYGLKNTIGVHSQVIARHAGEQGKWTAGMIQKLGIKSALFCVPAFHSLRAGLTTLEMLRRLEINDVLLLPACPAASPFEKSMLDVQTNRRDFNTFDVLWGEIDGGKKADGSPNERIPAYQKPNADGSPGDNLTTERFIEWLRFVYEHPFVKPHLFPGRKN